MPLLRPNSLAEALDMLARPQLVQPTVGGPPPRPRPHSLFMDVSRISEMAGIHRTGGDLLVGVSTSWADIMRATLLRPAAACLADAAAVMEAVMPGGALLHGLDAVPHDNAAVLAFMALGAKAEVAFLTEDGSLRRVVLPLFQALRTQDQPHLLLNCRFGAPLWGAGSALYSPGDISPMLPDATAAAAAIQLDVATGRVRSARLVFGRDDQWPILCDAAAALVDRLPNEEAIETVVRLARRQCSQSRASSPHFSLALSPHLIRETLDRAIARAQVT